MYCHRPSNNMTRNKQIVHPGLGKHYASPEKPGRRAKQQVLVSRPGQQSKRNQILKRLRELDEKKLDTSPVDVASEDVFDPPNPASEMDWEDEQVEHHHQIPDKLPMRRKPRDLKADAKVQYDAWKAIIPSLIQPLLLYIGASSGSPTSTNVDIHRALFVMDTRCHVYCVYFGIVSNCNVSYSRPLTYNVSSDYKTVDLPACTCRPLATILVENGLFPAAPSQPNLAISINFLEFYYALFEQSADAVGAMAAALSKFYNRRGFEVTDTKVSAHT